MNVNKGRFKKSKGQNSEILADIIKRLEALEGGKKATPKKPATKKATPKKPAAKKKAKK